MDRIATTLIVVYPSRMRRSSQANDAGSWLRSEVPGLYREVEPDGSIRFYACVMQG
jgi:hypothetical protein